MKPYALAFIVAGLLLGTAFFYVPAKPAGTAIIVVAALAAMLVGSWLCPDD